MSFQFVICRFVAAFFFVSVSRFVITAGCTADQSECIKCMRCIQVCDKVQSLSIWDVEGTGSRTTINVAGYKKIEEAACSLCGQCITHCPTGALTERDETEKVWNAIADPEKIVVVQIAPAVRAAWGEELGLSI